LSQLSHLELKPHASDKETKKSEKCDSSDWRISNRSS
jgi:hypothetical protein